MSMTVAVTGARGRVRRVGAVVLRDFYVLRRSPPRLLEIVYWPLVEVLIWGYVSVFLQANRWRCCWAGRCCGRCCTARRRR
jgi:ABC-2 type transport system permease protein